MTNQKKIFFLIFLMTCGFAGYAQQGGANWTFGWGAGLHFAADGTVSQFPSNVYSREGVGTISSQSTGALLFYSDGTQVWDASNNVMANGFGLLGDYSSSQSAVIVPLPGDSSRYYIFTAPRSSPSDSYYYSIVNMAANNGLGEVEAATKNTLILQNGTEKIGLARHCNGRDFWLILHETNSNNFWVYLLNENGLQPPQKYSVGAYLADYSWNNVGYLRVSSDEKLLAHPIGHDELGNNSVVELYNFDNTTGSISGPLVTLNNVGFAYGTEFSADSKLLYVTNINGLSGITSSVYQYDLSSGNAQTISNSRITLISATDYSYGAIQLAPNGKMYVAKEYGYDNGSNYLDVIESPSVAGVGCNYVLNGLTLTQGKALIGLPHADYRSYQPPPTEVLVPLCPKDSFYIAGIGYTAPDTILTPMSDCDVATRYTLVQLPYPETSDTVQLCPGTSITIGGNVYTEAGVVVDTIPSTTGGCDSIITYHIVRADNPTLQQTVSFCPGDTVEVNGLTYTEAGISVYYIVPASIGCDTVVQVHLQYAPQPAITKNIQFCSGDSVTIDGKAYFQPGTVSGVIPAATGCDTLATYVLEYLPQPTATKTIAFCSGDSVIIDGTAYFQPGTVSGVIPAATGCDTLATYNLTLLTPPTLSKTLAFCSGDSVIIDGVTYFQPGTVSGIIPAVTGCDTLVTYVLEFAPQPTRSQTIEFCAGDTVTIGGTVYTQPGTVSILEAASVGCDTLVTYTLQHPVPAQPTVISLDCPLDIYVDADPGQLSVPVVYDQPVATTDCPCPGVQLSQQQGLPSGGNFPQGVTPVCYNARDSCGASITCCFNVTVEEKAACDIKEINCIKYELLSITEDAQKRKTYRIRTTNNCANRLIYMAVQVPDGVQAVQPMDNATYTAPGGRTYLVRSPNFSPFYSVRFASLGDSIHNGESDVFKYTLPAQSEPDYLHVTVRLEPGIFYEAHLNTFFCPIEYEPNNQPADRQSSGAATFALYPNPTNGALFADLSAWADQQVRVHVFSAQGHIVQTTQMHAEREAQAVELPADLPNGIYFLEVVSATGQKWRQRFVIQH